MIYETKYDVLATLSGKGVVTLYNTMYAWTYERIYQHFPIHKVRLAICNTSELQGIYVIDLWSSQFEFAPPYSSPKFVPADGEFKFVDFDHALGWCVFNINSLD